MAHDCPDCGQACYCDIEDLFYDEAPDDCCHGCDPESEDDFVDLGGSDPA